MLMSEGIGLAFQGWRVLILVITLILVLVWIWILCSCHDLALVLVELREVEISDHFLGPLLKSANSKFVIFSFLVHFMIVALTLALILRWVLYSLVM